MPQSIINTNNVSEADALLVSAPYDLTASFHKGTAEGPKKIIDCLDTQIEFFDRRYKVDSTEEIKIAHIEIENMRAMTPKDAHDAVVNACTNSLAPLTFLIGGEHSVSFGALKALEKKHDPKDVTIVQIDAHCDLRKDDSDYNDENPTEYAHSAVMRRAHEMGFSLVQVGIRAFSQDEYEYFTNNKNITTFQWGLGKVPTITKILKSIKTPKVYISIDVDGFDPAYMPATGTPVQGGLEWYYGLELLEKVIEKKELVGADIVEVSPVPNDVRTEYGAAQIIYNMINTFFKKRLIK